MRDPNDIDPTGQEFPHSAGKPLLKSRTNPDPHRTPLPSWAAPALGAMIGALSALPAFQQHDGQMPGGTRGLSRDRTLRTSLGPHRLPG